ncbi:MAG TPA: dTMP kinase [Pyrinomonadaceae bacterium]|nr:dTMP kinase [Pyrinomonadaceae bacterium]
MIIVIEGIDAVGKKTQTQLLKTRAESVGLSSAILSFPRYGETTFANLIAKYLNGDFGELESVDPHFSALLYAGDRFESRDKIRHLAATHSLLIIDRYVASNVAYQAARVDLSVRADFVSWLSNLEYELYDLPRPDLNVYLDLPATTASQMIHNRKQRSYTEKVADLHEKDTDYLAACQAVYRTLIEQSFSGQWLTIQCARDNGQMREKMEIADAIWNGIDPVIQTISARAGNAGS